MSIRVAPLADGAARLHQRDECDLATVITRGRELAITGRVVDISRGGCSVRCDTLFGKGDRIRLLLPMLGDQEARVTWALRGAFGCQFSEAVAPLAYPRLLAAIKLGLTDWAQP